LYYKNVCPVYLFLINVYICVPEFEKFSIVFGSGPRIRAHMYLFRKLSAAVVCLLVQCIGRRFSFFLYIYVKKKPRKSIHIHILCDANRLDYVWKVTLFTIFSNTYFTWAPRLSEFVFSYNTIKYYILCVREFICGVCIPAGSNFRF